jgi:hypothetical protein
MPSLAFAPSAVRHLRRALRLAVPVGAAVVTAMAAAAVPLAAQVTLTHTEDAAPIPAGMLRFRVTTGWTRYDERFAAAGTVALGQELSADPLGVAQLPRLAPAEQSLQSLAADPALRLSLGRLRVGSNARIVTTPIALEYGITRRLSLGVVVPVVQTRRVIQATVNPDTTAPNVGYLAPAVRGQAYAANTLVAQAFRRAADSIGVLLARCPQSPTASGCAAVNANRADATAAQVKAQSFAGAIAGLGTDSASTILALRRGSAAANEIDWQRLLIDEQLQRFLGAGAGASTSLFTAPTSFSYIDLQGRGGVPGLLGSTLGGGLDSLHTTERFGVGDIGVGAQLMLFDRFRRDTLSTRRALQSRLAVGAMVRFATSRADSAIQLADIPTGEGAGVELRSALDLISGRVGSTIAARYVRAIARTVQASLVGDPEAPFPYPLFGPRQRRAGDVIGLDLTPRYLLNELFALDAHYGVERVGATTYDAGNVVVANGGTTASDGTFTGVARTAQRIGFGARYSTVDAFLSGRAVYPLEVSFTHLETIAGDAGVPKVWRDQVQLRLFYQLFGGR